MCVHRRCMLLAVLLAAALVAPARTSAQPRWQQPGHGPPPGPAAMLPPPPPPPPPRPLWRDARAIERLELSEAQVDALRDQDFDFREQALEVHAALARAQLALERAFAADAPGAEEVREAARTVAELRGQLFMQHIEQRLARDAILSAAQRRRLEGIPDGRPEETRQ